VTERAFLKVQDGCDYKCTYCTIPLARGFHEIGKCVEKTKKFQIKTSKIVLTGVELWKREGLETRHETYVWNWFKN
jgi:tRNA A37 methylthiotransferase MiaB